MGPGGRPRAREKGAGGKGEGGGRLPREAVGGCGSRLQVKGTVQSWETDYCVEINTLWRCSLGFCPAPVELQTRLAIRQLEHGDSLSQRI